LEELVPKIPSWSDDPVGSFAHPSVIWGYWGEGEISKEFEDRHEVRRDESEVIGDIGGGERVVIVVKGRVTWHVPYIVSKNIDVRSPQYIFIST
jgi:hypothetical protein